MNLILIIAVVAGIFIFFVALGFILKMLKKLLSLVFIILIITAVFIGYSAHKDIKGFVNDFNESSNVFLMMDEDTLEAGFIGFKDVEFFGGDLIEKHQRYINREKQEDILEDNYKVFFIDIVALEEEDNFDLILQERDIEKKSAMFSEIVAEKLDNDIMFFFREYKKDNIEVYPKTAIFKFIDVIPFSWLKKNVEKIKIKAGQEIKNYINNKTQEALE